jgi:hypothetical protein
VFIGFAFITILLECINVSISPIFTKYHYSCKHFLGETCYLKNKSIKITGKIMQLLGSCFSHIGITKTFGELLIVEVLF